MINRQNQADEAAGYPVAPAMRDFQIPPQTQEELANPAPVGQRHEQMLGITSKLMDAHIVDAAIFAQLRSMYSADVSDGEIRDVITWMRAKKEEAGKNVRYRKTVSAPTATKLITTDPKMTIKRVKGWLRGFFCSEECLWHASPWRPIENWRLDGSMLIAGLYDPDDYINILIDHTVTGNPAKATPRGPGITLRRDDWLSRIRESGPPESAAGAWMRPNPVVAGGSGNGGAFTDADVTHHRFILVESDILPPDLQLSVIAALRLPVAAIITSGGRSYHAWVRVDASDGKTHREIAKRIFGTLAPFGFDPQNSNPSRLSRFPGALRLIGAEADGMQRLIYLNPDAEGNGSIFNRT